MEFLSGAFAWILANWASIMGLLTAALTLGALIAKLTPSPKDDGVFAKLLSWLKLVPVPKTDSLPKPPPSNGGAGSGDGGMVAKLKIKK